MKLRNSIRNIPNFPKKGILFRDITTLLNNATAFKRAVDKLILSLKGKRIDYIVAAESRGFIFGGVLAYRLKCGFVPVRKAGKLPSKTYRSTYKLEYGNDTLEIHRDAFPPHAKILVLDDLLATGGTTTAILNLINKLKGNIVAIAYLIELTDLEGRKNLKRYPVYSIIKY